MKWMWAFAIAAFVCLIFAYLSAIEGYVYNGIVLTIIGILIGMLSYLREW